MSTLATLGPAGTDSESAARRLSARLRLPHALVLVPSFAEALEHAWENDGLALVPAAYAERDAAGRIVDCWADLNFRVETEGRLELWACHVLPLKELALARRRGVTEPRSVTLHPATAFYAQAFLPAATPRFCVSKPEAVRECVAGRSDACIGSIDVVQAERTLEIVRTFAARMCWTIYRRAEARPSWEQRP